MKPLKKVLHLRKHKKSLKRSSNFKSVNNAHNLFPTYNYKHQHKKIKADKYHRKTKYSFDVKVKINILLFLNKILILEI